jgi:hypothetical protein
MQTQTTRRSKDVGCYSLGRRGEEDEEEGEGEEWVTSRSGSLLGSHIHSGGFFLSFPI